MKRKAYRELRKERGVYATETVTYTADSGGIREITFELVELDPGFSGGTMKPNFAYAVDMTMRTQNGAPSTLFTVDTGDDYFVAPGTDTRVEVEAVLGGLMIFYGHADFTEDLEFFQKNQHFAEMEGERFREVVHNRGQDLEEMDPLLVEITESRPDDEGGEDTYTVHARHVGANGYDMHQQFKSLAEAVVETDGGVEVDATFVVDEPAAFKMVFNDLI